MDSLIEVGTANLPSKKTVTASVEGGVEAALKGQLTWGRKKECALLGSLACGRNVLRRGPPRKLEKLLQLSKKKKSEESRAIASSDL